MDKSTLSNYGWVVIVTLVLSVMLAFATPFGSYVARATANVIKYYKTVTGDTFSADYIEGKSKEWDDYINDTIPEEDIEESEYMYGIGKTKSEYVLAIFNEDYSTVRIVKNGANSDGLMKDFKPLSLFQGKDITNEEAMAAWEPYASPMQLHANTLKTAIIEKDVVSLGQYAFESCKNLQNITFANSLEIIDRACFKLCTNLKAVDIPEKIKEVSDNCFYGCNNLITVSLPDQITKISAYAFYNCTSLVNVNIPTNIKVIDSYSFFTTKIQKLEFPNGLTTLSNSAFMNCFDLETVSIPATTTRIDEAVFRRTSSLKNIDVDDNNPNYIDVNGVLYNTDKSLILSYPAKKEAESYTLLPTVKRIGIGAFSCTKMDTIISNNALEEIGVGAFEFSELKSYNITQNVKSIENAPFYRSYLVNTITVDSNNTNFKVVDDGVYSYDEKTFYFFPASNPRTTFTMLPSVTTIIDSAFSSSRNLQEVTISENVTKIPQYCFTVSRISKINLPSNLTVIGNWAFSETENLISIIIPENVTEIHDEAFIHSAKFTTIYGKSNSYAQTYANTLGYTFIPN